MIKDIMGTTGEQIVSKSKRPASDKVTNELLTTYTHAADKLEAKRLVMNDAIAEFRAAQRQLEAIARECADRYTARRGK